MRDKWSAENEIHIEQVFTIESFRDLVAGLLHQGSFFFDERGAFFSSNDEEAVRPVPVLERNSQQRFRTGRHHAEAHGTASVLILCACRHERRRGQRTKDGLHIAGVEPSGGMADEGTVFTVKDRRDRGVYRQVVEDRGERPLELGFAGRFTVLSRRCHSGVVRAAMRHCSNASAAIQRQAAVRVLKHVREGLGTRRVQWKRLGRQSGAGGWRMSEEVGGER